MPIAAPARTARGNRFARHPGRTALALAVIALAAIELATRVLVASGWLVYIPFRTTPRPTFWVDDHPVVGVWHPPHAEFRDVRGCFDVTYRTNSIGARDRERSRRGDAERRVIVLGDSFVEGLGVADEARVTDQLERRSGIEHLNFGTSGNFGTVQAALLYEALARDFEHSEVMLFVLPDNDFDDNDPSEHSPRRYRPYLRESESGFEVYYPVAFADRERDDLSARKIRKNRIFNASAFLNVLRHASHRWREDLDQAGEGDAPGYNNYTPSDLRVLLESVRRLLGSMGPDRPLTVVLIPRADEFQWMEEQEEPLRLAQDMQAFAANHARLRVVDLLPGFLDYAERHGIDWSEFFLPCDGHWSALGHAVASEVLLAAKPVER